MPTVVVSAALLQRGPLAVERLATILPLAVVVTGPAVCGAVREVGRGRRCHTPGARPARGHRGEGVLWRGEGQQRGRVGLLRRGGRGVEGVRVLPLQLVFRLEICQTEKRGWLQHDVRRRTPINYYQHLYYFGYLVGRNKTLCKH